MSITDLRKYAGLFSGYTELRVQENRNVQIVLVKGNIVANTRSSTGGVSARVYRDGSWGFASNPETGDDSIRSVVNLASANADFLATRDTRRKGPLPSTCATSDNDFSTSKPRLTQKQLIEFAREIDNHIAKTYPGLTSRSVVLTSLDMEKTLLTSEGSWSHSMIPRAFVRVSLSVEKDGQTAELPGIFGGLGQFEDVLTEPSQVFDGLEQQYNHLMKKSEGVFAEAGVHTCVLDAELAGILAHEAIGHTTEADLVIGGSVAGPLMGKEAASPLITLIDAANTCLGKTCPVPVYIDDEGTPAEDVVIIDKGILTSFMHNKESAAYFGTTPKGNARAFQFSDEPLIRMRNTAIMPGPSSLEDMIASVERGYYLIKPSNGQADTTSEFMFGVVLGYEIKDGKIGRAIKDTTISGVAFDVLRSVTMVSNDMKWSSSGMCGKKQPIPVGMGGPAIKCKVSIGGR